MCNCVRWAGHGCCRSGAGCRAAVHWCGTHFGYGYSDNPADTRQSQRRWPAALGKNQGVTIHLDRLAGLDPTNADDAARVRNANLDEVRDWRTDVHVDLVTNANGEVTFDGLAHGFYVVTSTAPDDSYREINPFVVAVPFHTVVDNPKPVPGVIVAKTHKPGETPTPPTSSSAPSAPPSRPDTPQTPPNYPPTKPGSHLTNPRQRRRVLQVPVRPQPQ